MRVVLLSCCAPCSAGAIKQLADGAIDGVDDFIVLFYNPNIFPESEYTKRMHEQIKYCESIGAKYIKCNKSNSEIACRDLLFFESHLSSKP